MRTHRTNVDRVTSISRSKSLPSAGMMGGILAFVAVVIAAMYGSTSRPSIGRQVRQHSGRLGLIAIDNSGSTESIRDDLESIANDTAEQLPLEDDLRMYKFASTVTEFYSGNVDNPDEFQNVLHDNVSPTDPHAGTDYGAIVARLNEVARTTEARSVYVLIVGDGLMDMRDSQSITRYQKNAQELISNPKVKDIRFWGVNSGAPGIDPRQDIRTMFAGRYSSKLRILNLDQSPW